MGAGGQADSGGCATPLHHPHAHDAQNRNEIPKLDFTVCCSSRSAFFSYWFWFDFFLVTIGGVDQPENTRVQIRKFCM